MFGSSVMSIVKQLRSYCGNLSVASETASSDACVDDRNSNPCLLIRFRNPLTRRNTTTAIWL